MKHFFPVLPEPLLLDSDVSGMGNGFFLPDEPAQPKFAEAETNVTAQLGGSIFLHCPVISSAGDRAVSYPSVSITLTLLT